MWIQNCTTIDEYSITSLCSREMMLFDTKCTESLQMMFAAVMFFGVVVLMCVHMLRCVHMLFAENITAMVVVLIPVVFFQVMRAPVMCAVWFFRNM